MSERLSNHALAKIYDAGLTSFNHSGNSKNPLPVAVLPWDAILASPKAKSLIRAMAPRELYLALKQRGISESLDVLELISQEQFQRFCDYDVWQDNRLSPKQLFSWLKLLNSISPKLMYQRFRGLEEEYQIATLAPLIRIFDADEYEKMGDAQQDRLFRFPGEELFFEVLSEDSDLPRDVEDLLGACIAEDMGYAMSLVTHAAYTPPQETEELLAQFRKARLEEDGFVTYDEAVTVFYPIPLGKGESQGDSFREHSAASFSQDLAQKKDSLLSEVLKSFEESGLFEQKDNFRKSLLHLSNSLCVVANLEPDDTRGLKQLFNNAYGLINIGLEHLSQGDKIKALEILQKEHPKTLFRTALTLVRQIQKDWIKAAKPVIPQVTQLESAWNTQKFALIQTWFDNQVEGFGLQETEQLKALFNRFPMVCVETNGTRLTFEPISTRGDLWTLQNLVQTWATRFSHIQ